MNPSDSFRLRLCLHHLAWEIRRLRWPLVAWLAVVLAAAYGVNSADWSWGPNLDTLRRMEDIAARDRVTVGFHLLIIWAVYLAGELFLPLQPGVVRARFAWPIRRTDALWVGLCIVVLLVVIPLVWYFRGWMMANGWDRLQDAHDREIYVRQYLLLPLGAAGLILAAQTTGDWGAYLLTAGLTALVLVWTESVPRFEPLHAGPASVGMAAALAAAFVMQRYPWRWGIYLLWVGGCVAFLR